MNFLRHNRWARIGLGAAVLIIAFLAFRPDKLFVDNAVDESLSDAFAAGTSLVATTSTTPLSATSTDATTTTLPASAPVVISEGTFSGIGHTGTGTARIYAQDGTRVLRFEDDTDIQNGPDLYVWLLESDRYDGGTPTRYIDLGKIKGNVGGQNYELPASYDPAVHKTVLVWCVRFSTPFAAAPLS